MSITKLIGTSNAMFEIEREIESAAQSDAKVLITGESGVGKDIVARLIHSQSRRQGPLVTVNCAGVADSLLESELFGHVRGSFTGAYRDKRGMLDQAQDGTIFLDEVGEMSPRMQSMLLRFLESGELQRVGSEHLYTVNKVRVIAATNRNLADHVADKAFREDLYYRLNVIHIVIPPLRDHPDDVAPLMQHFLATFSGTYQVPRPRLSEEAMAKLTAYSWPGNVRELRNLAERLVVRGKNDVIKPNDLAATMSIPARPLMLAPPTVSRVQQPTQSSDALYQQMVDSGQSFWAAVYGPFVAHDLTREDLRALVARGLAQTRGSYKGLLAIFNLPLADYKRFLTFLKKHECRLPSQTFRSMPLPPRPPLPSQGLSATGFPRAISNSV